MFVNISVVLLYFSFVCIQCRNFYIFTTIKVIELDGAAQKCKEHISVGPVVKVLRLYVLGDALNYVTSTESDSHN